MKKFIYLILALLVTLSVNGQIMMEQSNAAMQKATAKLSMQDATSTMQAVTTMETMQSASIPVKVMSADATRVKKIAFDKTQIDRSKIVQSKIASKPFINRPAKTPLKLGAEAELFFDNFEAPENSDENLRDTPFGWTSETGPSANTKWMAMPDWAFEYFDMPMRAHSPEVSIFSYNNYSSSGASPDIDAWIFTQAIPLDAGSTYRISFWVEMPGYPSFGEYQKLEVKIGTSASAADMTKTLYSNTTNRIAEWTQITCNFTVDATTDYYIGFHDFTNGGEGDYILIDDVSVEKVPDVEVELISIVTPNSGQNLTATEQVKVSFKNNGVNSLSSVHFKLKLGDDVIAPDEEWTGDLASGASTEYTFTGTLNLSTPDDYLVTVVATVAGDENPDNDSLSKAVKCIGTITPPYFEDFEATTGNDLPVGWERTGVAVTGSNPVPGAWTTAAGTHSYSGVTIPANSGTRHAVSFAYSAPGAMDNWMFTPEIYLTEGTTYDISFWVVNPPIGYGAGNTAPHNLEVKLGSGAAVVNMDSLLYRSTIEISSYTQVTVRYTAEASQSYVLGFHDYTPAGQWSGFVMMIDDISVKEALQYEAAGSGITSYTQIPTHQTNVPLHTMATVSNIGLEGLTNIQVSGEFNGSTFGTFDAISTLAPGASTTVVSAPENVTAVLGENKIKLSATSTEIVAPVEIGEIGFTGSKSLYKLDNDGTNGFYSALQPTRNVPYGHVFDITQQTILTEAQILIALAASGTYSVDLTLFEMDGATNTCKHAALFTSTVGLPNATAGNYTLTCGIPQIILEPGRYFLGYIQTSATTRNVWCDNNPARFTYQKNGDTLAKVVSGASAIGALNLRMILPEESGTIPTPTAFAASNIKQSTATLSWEHDSVRNSVQRIMIYETESGNYVTGYTLTAKTHNLTGLKQNTDYTAYVFVVDGGSPNTIRSATATTTFKTLPDTTHFVVTDIALASGNNMSATASIGNITVRNAGTSPLTGTINLPLTLEIDGTVVGTENTSGGGTGTWAVNGNRTNYTTAMKADLSAPGEHKIRIWLTHPADSIVKKDTFEKTIFNTVLDLQATGIEPFVDGQTETNLTNAEILRIKVKNNGNSTVAGFPILYSLNGAVPVSKNVGTTSADSLAAGAEKVYEFSTKLDLSETRTHTIKAWPYATTDLIRIGDTVTVTFNHKNYKDLDIITFITPNSGVGLTNKEEVKVKITNKGNLNEVVDITLVLDGEIAKTNTLSAIDKEDTIEFAFDTLLDLSDYRTYSLMVYIANGGDTIRKTVINSATEIDDVEIVAISSPNSGYELSASETVTVRVQNHSTKVVANLPVTYSVNEGTEVKDTIPSIAIDGYVDFSFEEPVDLHLEGDYKILVKTYLEGDGDTDNDTMTKVVTNTYIYDIALSNLFNPSRAAFVDSIPVSVRINNNGTLDTDVRISYNATGNEFSSSESVLVEDIPAKGFIDYTFPSELAFLPKGDVALKVWVDNVAEDTNKVNDTISRVISNNVNVSVYSWQAPATSGNNMTATEAVTVTIANTGSLSMRDVDIILIVDGAEIATEQIALLPSAAGTSGRTQYKFTATADLSEEGTHTVSVRVNYHNGDSIAGGTRNVTNTVVTGRTIPFSEDFEGTTGNSLPEDWTRSGATVSGSNPVAGAWTSAAGSYSYSGVIIPAHGGTRHTAAFAYGASGAMNAWMFTPGLALTEDVEYAISFWYFIPEITYDQQGSVFSPNKLEVKIGTGATAAGMEATALFTGEITTNNYTKVTVRYTPATTGVYYIGFHDFTPSGTYSGFLTLIDDILVTEVKENDLQLVANPFPYTQIPVSQGFPSSLSAKAINKGSAAQTNVKFGATLDGTPIGESAPAASLAPGTTSDDLTITPTATTITLGDHTVVYTVSGDQTNESTDNTAIYTFNGTENVYAVDELTGPTGDGGIGAQSAISCANIFEIYSATTLKQVVIGFESATSLNYSISLYRMTNALSYNTTAIFTQSATRNAIGFATVDVPLTRLEPGRYVLAVNQLTTTSIALSNDGMGTGRLLYILQGGTLNVQDNLGAVAIRMVIDDNAEVPVTVVSKTPEEGASNVARDAEVKVTFNQNITEGTLTGITFTPSVEGVSASVSGANLIITHDQFAENTAYTVNIPAGAVEGYDQAISWSFTVGATGVEELNKALVSVYPNPVSDILYIKTAELIKQIEVLNVDGKLLKTVTGAVNELSVRDLRSGAYILRIITEKGVVIKRIIKN